MKFCKGWTGRLLLHFSTASQFLLWLARDPRRGQSAERANMEPIAHLVKVSVPNYLAGLPIPDSIGGWFRLGGNPSTHPSRVASQSFQLAILFVAVSILSRAQRLIRLHILPINWALFFFFLLYISEGLVRTFTTHRPPRGSGLHVIQGVLPSRQTRGEYLPTSCCGIIGEGLFENETTTRRACLFAPLPTLRLGELCNFQEIGSSTLHHAANVTRVCCEIR